MAYDIAKIRADFPLLGRKVYGRELAYLDNGATAQKPLQVIEKIDYLHRELNANVHRGLHYLSEECTSEYEAAREQVRALIGAASVREIVFTAGATAAINTVAYSFGEKYIHAGDNVITTEMEHHANIVPWQLICERKGAELRVVPFDDAGRLMTEKLPELLDERTRIVCITQASNVLGTRPDLSPVDRPGAPGRGAGAGGRLSGYCARRGRCAGARLRFLCLFGTQTLRTYRNRRVVRQGEMAGTDAAVHGRGRYGR